MKVIDLHPEDLLDKSLRGELSKDESARLDAHLARCETCRFERALRADFQGELDEEMAVSSQRLAALLEGLPSGDPRLPLEAATSPRPEPTVVPTDIAPPVKTPSTRPGRGRRKTRVVMLVAAALFIGGVATAGVGARAWKRVAATFSSDPTPAPVATLVPPAARLSAAPPLRSPAASEEPAPSSPEPPPPLLTATPAIVETPPVTSPVGVRPAPSSERPEVVAETAASMFEKANEARRDGDYARATFLHRRLQSRFPSSREAHVSHGTLGRLLLDRGEPAAALASFDDYRARGAGPLDEAVLVGRATALERLGRRDEASSAWSALLTAFPDTPYADHARSRLTGDSSRPR